MKNILKKTFVFLIAFAMIAQATIIVPSLTLKAYADTEENIAEVSADFQNIEENTEYTDIIADVPASMDVIASEKAEDVAAVETSGYEEEQTDGVQTRGPPEEGSDLTVLAFSSDVHNQLADHLGAERLATWIDKIYSIYDQQIEVMGFCGDLGDYQGGVNYWNLVQEVMDVVNARIPDEIGQVFYTTGNHEYDHKDDSSIYTHDLNDITSQYIEDQPAIDTENYHIYCVGTSNFVSEGQNIISINQINALSEYLDSIEDDKPIIILNHYPLHFTTSRTIRRADMMIDRLNSAAQSGKKIVFLWGHNHTNVPRTETHYDKIFKPGDSIEVTSGRSAKIEFYYAAAGCMSDDEYNINAQQGSGFVEGKGLVITINSDNLLSFTYYDEYGNDQTVGGSYIERKPVPVTGIKIDEVTKTGEDGQQVVVDVPVIEVKESLQLSATLEPEDTTDTDLTWSSSDPSIATVSASGKVKGVSEGETTITVSAGQAGAVVSDSIVINVIPCTSSDKYYVIKIGDYALSSRASSASLTNDSGYAYFGLQAIAYDTNQPAPQHILWMLEEPDDDSDGYYIKSYDGYYLYARYDSNGRGYTGRLIATDSPQDVWIVNDGIENWEGEGSTLQSSNASTSSKAMYLATTQANNGGEYFFTVRSSSSGDTTVQRTSQLIEPVAIAEPVPVEDIIVDPTSLELEVGQSANITATVIPENADDTTFYWQSADETIATVSDSGRVKGIAEGETDILAVTTDGQKTAACHVTVVQRTSEEQYFVIRIGDYAMSSVPASVSMSNENGYHYHGLRAVVYDSNAAASQDILWTLEEAEETTNGYYIRNFNGEYLSATYVSNSSGRGYTGTLIVSDSPEEIWIVNGGLENWMGDGSTLQSSNASTSSKPMYLATTQANNGGEYFFTVRSSSSGDTTVQRTSLLIAPEELAYKWSAPTWTWDGYSSATATFIYADDPTHTTVIEAEITKDETGTGFIPFTATVTFNGNTYTDTKQDTITVSNKLELNAGIILHILLKNLPEGSSPEDYTISYNDLDGNMFTDVPLTSVEENEFSVGVDAPEMTEKVNITIKYKGTEIYSNYSSVQKYCDKVIETSEDDAYKELCYAILDYGTFAQKKFNKNTDDLANANHPDNPYEVIEIPETTVGKTQDERVSAISMSLDFRYETEMRFYITPASGFNASDFSIDVLKDGKAVDTEEFECVVREDGKLLVIVKNIAAAELSEIITVTASLDETVSVQVKASPIWYLYAAKSVSGMEELCKAMYNYHLKAVRYFSNQ